jgi:hypothetical protein
MKHEQLLYKLLDGVAGHRQRDRNRLRAAQDPGGGSRTGVVSQLFDRESHPDRPWKGRGYGRIRLDESLARDLAGIMYDVVGERLTQLHDAKERGDDTTQLKQSLRRANAIRERVVNLISEQGWEDKTDD